MYFYKWSWLKFGELFIDGCKKKCVYQAWLSFFLHCWSWRYPKSCKIPDCFILAVFVCNEPVKFIPYSTISMSFTPHLELLLCLEKHQLYNNERGTRHFYMSLRYFYALLSDYMINCLNDYGFTFFSILQVILSVDSYDLHNPSGLN